MLCGSPDWNGFAAKVVKVLREKGVLNFLEEEQLLLLRDPRRTLSIARRMADAAHIEIDFDGILHPTSQGKDGVELYKVLSEMRPVFVTTNYDKWLHLPRPKNAVAAVTSGGAAGSAPSFEDPKYFRAEHLTLDRLTERGEVIHLHGAYNDPKSMIVSLSDYVEHYAKEKVRTFLEAMLDTRTVVFVGYGLAELEILEYIVRRNRRASKDGEPRHFLLYPHRSNEIKQTEYLKDFYRHECGVEVIEYCIDDKGFSEVVDLLKFWRPLLEVKEPNILDLQAYLDMCVKDPSAPHREAAIGISKKHPELSAYLVNALTDELWFRDLVQGGFFDLALNPGLVQVPGKEGYVQSPDWPALRYLERIAPRLSGEMAVEVAELVRTIGKDGQAKGLENWRTWWALVAVLVALPLDVIAESDMELFRYWMRNRLDGDMTGQVLGEKLLPRLLDSDDPRHWELARLLVEVLTEWKPEEPAK